MAMTPNVTPTATELWVVIKKEITGIQLVWEALNGLYFAPQGKGWRTWEAEEPLLISLTQTALMESLLMRVSRMMDPAATGKMTNLSLKRLAEVESSVGTDENEIRAIWNSSGLKTVRDKYLSHNDLNRLMSEDHSLNIPLDSADIDALCQLADGLRVLRRNVNHKFSSGSYVDQCLDAKVRRDIETLNRLILAGEKYFEELPDRLLAAGC
jgi:AbiU2